MTTSADNRIETYPGAGSTGPFTFDFPVSATSGITLTKYDSSNNPTTLTITTDYSVSLTSGGASGGSVTLVTALAVGENLTIEGNTPLTQATPFKNQGAFFAEKHEAAYDKLTWIVQEINRNTGRAVELSPLDDDNSIDRSLPVLSANKAIITNSSGDGFDLASFASLVGDIDTTLGTLANNDFLVYQSGSGTWENKTLAETKSILGVGDDALPKEGSSLASASTVDLGAADSNFVQITGTTGITSFGTTTDRNHLWLYFADALTLTHNATSLILPTGANITTAANDRCEAIRLASGNGNWIVVNYQRANGQPLTTELSSDASPQLGGALDTDDNIVQFSKGSDIASANPLVLGTDGNYFDVTGTTGFASISTTGRIGTTVKLHFDGVLTITHNATDLSLPGGADITTAAGDEAEFVEYASGDFICVNYTRASGLPVAIKDEDDMASDSAVHVPTQQSVKAYVDENAVAITPGTPVTLNANRTFTGIPSGVNRVTLLVTSLSTSGSFCITLGDSGGLEGSGYSQINWEENIGSADTFGTTGDATRFIFTQSNADFYRLVFERITGNTWVLSGVSVTDGSNLRTMCFGSKTLSSELTQIRLFSSFSNLASGTAQILYE